MKYRTLGNTGIEISAVMYGGIVSSETYEGVTYPGEDQALSDRYVAWAIERGVNYFDVAPTYGNAEERLGNSLVPYRNKVRLTCKTRRRDLKSAQVDLERSMKLLHTDHFDVYQLHEITTMKDVDTVFGPGGAMEMICKLKERGIADHIGFTAHNEDCALRMLELYPFETVLFPFNWFMNMAHGMGDRLLVAAHERGMGVLSMKSFVERRWEDGEDQGCFPKS